MDINQRPMCQKTMYIRSVLIFSASVASIAVCSAQGRDRPVFEYPRIASPLWTDSNLVKRYGTPEFRIDSIMDVQTDSGLVRLEWGEHGELDRLAMVIQEPRVDSTFSETFGDGGYTLEVTHGIGDIPHGFYKQRITEGSGGWRSGYMRRGVAIGTWQYVNDRGNLQKTIQLNERGQPEGRSIEYHPNGSVAWEGQFEVRSYTRLRCGDCPPMGKGDPREEVRESVPAGTWKRYDDQGTLLESVDYTWLAP